MGTTTWFYACRLDGTAIQKAAVDTEQKFLNGKGPFKPAQDGYVYLAAFGIELVDRKPVRVITESYTKHRVTSDHVLDTGHDADVKSAAMNSALSSDDADRRMAKRRLEVIGCWHPTVDEATALVELMTMRGVKICTPGDAELEWKRTLDPTLDFLIRFRDGAQPPDPSGVFLALIQAARQISRDFDVGIDIKVHLDDEGVDVGFGPNALAHMILRRMVALDKARAEDDVPKS